MGNTFSKIDIDPLLKQILIYHFTLLHWACCNVLALQLSVDSDALINLVFH